MSFLESQGTCPTCLQAVTFRARGPWLRDDFLCTGCGSVPRERALMLVLDELFPGWPDLVIHESSPTDRGATHRLRTGAPGWFPSFHFPGAAPGEFVKGYRSEDLENLSFADESIDLHVTQDVMEHIFRPERAFAEIARTLRPGGAHVFTTPLVRKREPSVVRAVRTETGEIRHLLEPVYHGDPIDRSGTLVTVDWGFDICEKIHDASGLFTHIIRIDDLSKGIRAEYIEVLVTMKS